MSLTQEQIEKLSKNLSKIRLGSGNLAESIESILGYVKMLDEVDTTGVKPTVSVVEKENTLRKDVEKRDISHSELLACSGQKVIGNQIAVTNIMK